MITIAIMSDTITRDIYYKLKRKEPIHKVAKECRCIHFFRNISIHCLNVNMILKYFE